jgi:catechol 2,3-dioxygenase-like lactoylglutathione lyase family enzyme
MARIRHIAIASEHPGKAAEFYRQALGWEEVKRFGPPAKPGEPPNPSAVLMTDGHINIAVIRFSEDQIGVGTDFKGLHHIGVVVDDVDAWTPKLEALGSPLIVGKDRIPPNAHPEIKFRGPDNVVFDISHLAWPGSAPVKEEELAEARSRRLAQAAE